jgi:hypothetical protein
VGRSSELPDAMDVGGGKHLASPRHRRVGKGWVNDRGPTMEQACTQHLSLEASSQRLPDSILCIRVTFVTTMEEMLASACWGVKPDLPGRHVFASQ